MRFLPLLALLVFSGCVQHISPYRARHREFDYGEYPQASPRAPGSVYNPDRGPLLENDRARRAGDIVIVQIDEADTGSHDSSSKLASSNKTSIDSSGLLTALKNAAPALDLASLLGLSTKSDFQGAGQISRQGKLSASLALRVFKVMPNGDFVVEGTKVLMVGDEEHHLYISGLVRANDLRSDGSISSSRVADAEIEYTGRGVATDTGRQGWLTRLWKKFSPL